VFTHLDRRGQDLGFSDWQRVDVREFEARTRRFLSRELLWPATREPTTTGSFQIEALEVFIATKARHFEPAARHKRVRTFAADEQH
jgi:hypothetical protein